MADVREGTGVTIVVGHHKGETGLVVNRTGGDAWVVLTLAGDYHTYRAEEMRALDYGVVFRDSDGRIA